MRWLKVATLHYTPRSRGRDGRAAITRLCGVGRGAKVYRPLYSPETLREPSEWESPIAQPILRRGGGPMTCFSTIQLPASKSLGLTSVAFLPHFTLMWVPPSLEDGRHKPDEGVLAGVLCESLAFQITFCFIEKALLGGKNEKYEHSFICPFMLFLRLMLVFLVCVCSPSFLIFVCMLKLVSQEIYPGR